MPSPKTEPSEYASIIASLVNEAPIPSKSPATGKSAIGSINERPTR